MTFFPSSLRALFAFLTSILISLIIAEPLIGILRKKQKKGQPIRKDVHLSGHKKDGTPTMGGVIMLCAVVLTSLLWCDIKNAVILTIIGTMLVYAFLGFVDDYIKVTRRKPDGVLFKAKIMWQFCIAFFLIFIITKLKHTSVDNVSLNDGVSTISWLSWMQSVSIPFTCGYSLDIGLLYYVFAACVIVGSSNAVNLTDGLDGLASGNLAICLSFIAALCYIAGSPVLAEKFYIKYVPDALELMVIIAAIVGACIGFLWYNAHPARIFMGDVGSLSMGAVVGVASILLKQELILLIIGGVFVMEAASVILQVGVYKLKKKRIFRMAPIHHHFERAGLHETTIVIRFWIVGVIFGVCGFIGISVC